MTAYTVYGIIVSVRYQWDPHYTVAYNIHYYTYGYTLHYNGLHYSTLSVH